MDERDDRLRATPHLDIHISEPALETEAAAKGNGAGFAPAIFLDVEPRAIGLARTPHHDHAHTAIVIELSEIIVEFADHVGRDRIERLWPVERQPIHLPAFLDD